MLSKNIQQYIEEHSQETYDLLVTLAQIPSPSNHEEKRAEFILDLLQSWGAEGAFIDEALNVVYPYADDGKQDLSVFMAHIDVVFPDTEPLPIRTEGDRLYCPGVGDDTANLVAMLMVVRYLLQEKMTPKDTGILFVANSGEEGLGNLKGSRKICETYGRRIRRFYSFDGGLSGIVCGAVGSARYKVTAHTAGGHSYGKFGAANAIHAISGIVNAIYALQVPEYGRTTYNVGMISGGTSVNSIAQQAEILCEYRSDDPRSMAIMEEHFRKIFAGAQNEEVRIETELVGLRPCGSLQEDARREQEDMLREASAILEEYGGAIPRTGSGSTDCNIPLSMNIPAICYGFYRGQGAHTREEYVEIPSLKTGYYAAFESILAFFA